MLDRLISSPGANIYVYIYRRGCERLMDTTRMVIATSRRALVYSETDDLRISGSFRARKWKNSLADIGGDLDWIN